MSNSESKDAKSMRENENAEDPAENRRLEEIYARPGVYEVISVHGAWWEKNRASKNSGSNS